MLKKILEWFEEHKLAPRIFLLITIAIITYFSSLPGTALSFGSIFPSIIYHFSIFAGFALFFLMSIAKKKLKLKEILFTIIVSSAVAVSDEIHQLFVPFRSCSIWDVMIDLAGICSSMLVYFLIKKLGR